MTLNNPNIEESISNLISTFRENYNIPGYMHNSYDIFNPGVSPVYYSGPYFDDREVIASVETMLTGKWMSSGENVREFEKAFSRKINQHLSCMVNSGSSANLVMIAALKKRFEWEDGSEIIVSAVGFPTTISVISQNNMVPVFIDIELDTLNFNVELIEYQITDKTKAIFLSPVLGNPPDMDRLVEICNKYNLKLVLDNCDSLGSKWNGKFLNEYAVASSCSFYAAHTICTFEGGMVTSNDAGIIKIAKSISNWGRGCVCSGIENLLPNGICNHRFDTWLEGYDGIVDHKYVFENIGYNLKPLDVCGSVGLVQLDKLDEILWKRKYSHDEIVKGLRSVRGVRTAVELPSSRTSWFGVPIICSSRARKGSFVSFLEGKKIQTRNYFAGNILLHPGYKHLGNYREYAYSNTVLDNVFFIGASPSYTDKVLDYIKEVFEKYDKTYNIR